MARNHCAVGLTCVNLWRMLGDEYKISTDPAYDKAGIRRVNLDPWYFTIPCKYGTIWPYGGDVLAIEIDYHNPTAQKVRAIPGVKVKHDGDKEKTFLFPLRLFADVARLCHPYRRPRLTPEQKAERAERLRQYHFQHRGSDQVS